MNKTWSILAFIILFSSSAVAAGYRIDIYSYHSNADWASPQIERHTSNEMPIYRDGVWTWKRISDGFIVMTTLPVIIKQVLK